MSIQLGTLETPIGRLLLAARDGRVCLLHFDASERSATAALRKWYPDETIERSRNPGGVSARLACYFEGELSALDDIDVEMNGTGFQQRVWTALRAITPGRTSSYSALARRIGAPSAVRAVGAANGANPVAIIVPCHRIVGADGSLTGYGGGLQRKEWLLRHEKARLF